MSAAEAAASGTFRVCRTCGCKQNVPPLGPNQKARCVRCHSVVMRRGDPTGNKTLAFGITALVLFFPANLYPLIHFSTLGRPFSATIFDGVWHMSTTGKWPLGILVFFTAILMPAVRIGGLCYLGWTSKRGRTLKAHGLYRFVSWAAGWAMVDVLTLATLVALIKLSDLVGASPGLGLYALALLMLAMAIAAVNTDRTTLWAGDGHPNPSWK